MSQTSYQAALPRDVLSIISRGREFVKDYLLVGASTIFFTACIFGVGTIFGGGVKIFDNASVVVFAEDLNGVFRIGEVDIGSFEAGFDAAKEVVGATSGVDDDLNTIEDVEAFTFSAIGRSDCFGALMVIVSTEKLNGEIGVRGAIGERDNKHKSIIAARATNWVWQLDCCGAGKIRITLAA